jgi:hypothetical protein
MKILVLVLALATTAAGQTTSNSKKTPEQLQMLFAQHKGDFDYLLGEYRLVDDKGETFYVTATIRNYDVMHDRWELIGMDDRNGLQDFGTANRAGQEMHIEQKFGVSGGSPTIMRIRYYNIKPNSFSWAGDQSSDNGKTWVKDHLRIEAKRIGPARTQPPLAKTK